MYGAQKQDSRVIINRINELPEPVQFFIREVLKKQYVPVAAIFYQDVEPYKISEWDDYWDGGEYEVLIVLDGDWEDERFLKQRNRIVDVSLKTDQKYGSIYVDDIVVGYWISNVESFLLLSKKSYTYHAFILKNGKLVYATTKFLHLLEGNSVHAGIYGITDVDATSWYQYSLIWFDIADYACQRQYYSHSAYSYRMSIELSLKALLWIIQKEARTQHNLEKLYRDAKKYFPDLDAQLLTDLGKLYKDGADFRYPNSSWIPTKEEIEKLFRPTAKKVLDYVSSKISQ